MHGDVAPALKSLQHLRRKPSGATAITVEGERKVGREGGQKEGRVAETSPSSVIASFLAKSVLAPPDPAQRHPCQEDFSINSEVIFSSSEKLFSFFFLFTYFETGSLYTALVVL